MSDLSKELLRRLRKMAHYELGSHEDGNLDSAWDCGHDAGVRHVARMVLADLGLQDWSEAAKELQP